MPRSRDLRKLAGVFTGSTTMLTVASFDTPESTESENTTYVNVANGSPYELRGGE
jgi:hypothetical protein